MPPESTEHYKNSNYLRCAELDCWGEEGMSLEERHQREADFALKSSGLDIAKDDAILDLASGSGGHARRMATVTEANITARDISKALIDVAQQKELTENLVDPTRKAIDHALGDMTDIRKLSLPEEKKYKLITILGSSFIFLHTREKYIQTLRELRSLLEDGGKIVIQFRVYKPECIDQLPRDKKRHISSIAKAPRQTNPVEIDENWAFHDKTKGDSFSYRFDTNPEVYDPSLTIVKDENGHVMDILNTEKKSLVVQRGVNGNVMSYRAPDGIMHMSFDRDYTDPSGKTESLGVNTFDVFNNSKTDLDLLGSFLSEAGFQNVQLKSEILSPEKNVYQVSIVGEK